MEGQTEEGKQKKHSRANNDLQNSTQKSKGRATQTSLKSGGEVRCSERVSNSCSIFTSGDVVIERCHSKCNLEMEK